MIIDRCRCGIGMTERNVPKVINGSKTQTRRIIRVEWSGMGRHRAFRISKNGPWINSNEQLFAARVLSLSPYKERDLLYIKEALKKAEVPPDYPFARYKADSMPVQPRGLNRPWKRDDGTPWKQNVIPARYMPRSAARTAIKITAVRVERINDISETDCQAEGCTFTGTMAGTDSVELTYRGAFSDLWNDTNGKDAWERNDWVFAYDFKVITNEEET